ncbi:hypothetical protein KL930_005224 [Ogataea haglerorum]|nr:hypothetical protein KL915_005144 [Ogataea haglerorum]KAG7772588.1 hypothetical protein KL930_005224 [Ogataea haglerorum]KAG7773923.1 hypothetical protein KL922_005095 [Ogataea haglerorum]
MLRSAKSLPAIGAVYRQAIQKDIPNISRGFAHQRTKTGFSKDDLAVRPNKILSQVSTRGVHQTSRTQLIMDLGSSGKYASMNLQGLKTECKRRGLKVSGRKIDLVQRLIQNDTSSISPPVLSRTITTKAKAAKPAKTAQKATKQPARELGSTASNQAKGDSSSIDFYKVPQKSYPVPDGRPPMKVPSLSTKASLKDPAPATETTTETVLQAVDSAPVSKSGQVLQTTAEQIHGAAEKSRSDALFFGIFGLLTLGWWSQKSKDGRQ